MAYTNQDPMGRALNIHKAEEAAERMLDQVKHLRHIASFAQLDEEATSALLGLETAALQAEAVIKRQAQEIVVQVARELRG